MYLRVEKRLKPLWNEGILIIRQKMLAHIHTSRSLKKKLKETNNKVSNSNYITVKLFSLRVLY